MTTTSINRISFNADSVDLIIDQVVAGWMGVRNVVLTAGSGDFDAMVEAIRDYGLADHYVDGYVFGNPTHRGLMRLFDSAQLRVAEMREDEFLAERGVA